LNFSFNLNQSPSTFYKHFYQKSNSLQPNSQHESHASCTDSAQGSSTDRREALSAKLFLFCISRLPLSVEPLRVLASSIAPSLQKNQNIPYYIPILWVNQQIKGFNTSISLVGSWTICRIIIYSLILKIVNRSLTDNVDIVRLDISSSMNPRPFSFVCEFHVVIVTSSWD